MPAPLRAMMQMVKIPGMDKLMTPVTPKMMPDLMPKTMENLMPNMLPLVAPLLTPRMIEYVKAH